MTEKGATVIERVADAQLRDASFEARYHVVVPNHRLVYTYDLHVNDKHVSTSLATNHVEVKLISALP